MLASIQGSVRQTDAMLTSTIQNGSVLTSPELRNYKNEDSRPTSRKIGNYKRWSPRNPWKVEVCEDWVFLGKQGLCLHLNPFSSAPESKNRCLCLRFKDDYSTVSNTSKSSALGHQTKIIYEKLFKCDYEKVCKRKDLKHCTVHINRTGSN